MTEADLVRFAAAQAPVHSQVVAELTAGCKRTHWMWFIFPQLAGLGHSAMAQRYAIRDLDQAIRYLADPILGDRLRHDVRLMIDHKGKSALEILGAPDDLKFRSCLTLFGQAASDNSDRMLFNEALDRFYGGEPDPRTLELLGSMRPSRKMP
ncbi:MAG TPA: DUF1810 domain-containing protein [Pseudomonadota bacterium]|nr:DUF1810 domain-containing protein [Pseudomonadota bacterium]